ncbi:winged helix-turn-helix transcriptional regulator [Magnetospirillum moscoviense]|uniref:Uncharacterized protein n=1 Tax=Magnetospirillum moscoviense TaxID=1437059 RepID=A0A178MY87_9PROT|nr:winged helix-turn-helix transcriptional regulator [Magnetospirillum moscoviense]OAN54997.1 hypothetical protein A6A05_00100 [Magnetospirillum moscoviense]
MKLLSAIDGNSRVTQRTIARDLGIALGLANAYLKRCVKTGLIKVAMAPANRYAYYLTPTGLAEKGRLTAEFLRQSFYLVRAARQEYGDIFAACSDRGWKRVVLWGASEIGEMAVLAALDHPVEILGFVDDAAERDRCAALAVLPTPKTFSTAEAAIVTDLKAPQATFDRARAFMGPDRVFAPRFLGISVRSGVEDRP